MTPKVRYRKKLIEVALPRAKINEAAAREKSRRKSRWIWRLVLLEPLPTGAMQHKQAGEQCVNDCPLHQTVDAFVTFTYMSVLMPQGLTSRKGNFSITVKNGVYVCPV